MLRENGQHPARLPAVPRASLHPGALEVLQHQPVNPPPPTSLVQEGAGLTISRPALRAVMTEMETQGLQRVTDRG